MRVRVQLEEEYGAAAAIYENIRTWTVERGTLLLYTGSLIEGPVAAYADGVWVSVNKEGEE